MYWKPERLNVVTLPFFVATNYNYTVMQYRKYDCIRNQIASIIVQVNSVNVEKCYYRKYDRLFAKLHDCTKDTSIKKKTTTKNHSFTQNINLNNIKKTNYFQTSSNRLLDCVTRVNSNVTNLSSSLLQLNGDKLSQRGTVNIPIPSSIRPNPGSPRMPDTDTPVMTSIVHVNTQNNKNLSWTIFANCIEKKSGEITPVIMVISPVITVLRNANISPVQFF